MNTEFSTFDIYLPRQLHSTCEICDLFYDSTTYLPYWFSCFYEMSVRAFEILLKLVRSQWLKIEKFHITKEANWHFSFLNSLSNEVPQSQKRNPSAKHSQSATFGGSPAKQGRALTTSVLVRFV